MYVLSTSHITTHHVKNKPTPLVNTEGYTALTVQMAFSATLTVQIPLRLQHICKDFCCSKMTDPQCGIKWLILRAMLLPAT